MSKYRKAFVAAAGVLTVLGGVLSDGELSYADASAVALAAVTAIGVYFAPNKQPEA